MKKLFKYSVTKNKNSIIFVSGTLLLLMICVLTLILLFSSETPSESELPDNLSAGEQLGADGFSDDEPDNTLNQILNDKEHDTVEDISNYRIAIVNAATKSSNSPITLVDDVKVSRTGIAFSLENCSDLIFNYGEHWDLAHILDDYWSPVPHLAGLGSVAWVDLGYSLQSGGIKQYYPKWDWIFGELPPGRYMFIREGWLGDWNPNRDIVYALVEFVITDESPINLPPQSNEITPNVIELISFDDVTPNGMTIKIENISPYDINHRAQLLDIALECCSRSEFLFDWQSFGIVHSQPLEEDELAAIYMHGEGFLPSGEQMEFRLDWTTAYGELPPGEYRIALSIGGRANAPHPTGWAFNRPTLVILFTVLESY
ncbi:MAG: hypothetical protein LBC73_10290 [Oscillospiraceae bacterium]|jgi:hypothetical protein|nr:hypothetical protein [Oscillospiraceae bacterium]